MGELFAVREELTASKQTTAVMLRGAVDEFNQERTSLEKDLEYLRVERDELRQTNTSLTTEVESSRSELTQLRQKLTEQVEEAARAIDCVNRSKKQLKEDLGFEIEKLSLSCARLEAELGEKERRFQKELSAAHDKYDSLSYAKNRTEDELNQVMEEFVNYQKEQESAQVAARATVEGELREMEEQLEERSEAVQRVAERLRRREMELESAKKELEHMSSTCHRREEETRRLNETLDMERNKHCMNDLCYLYLLLSEFCCNGRLCLQRVSE